jgi:AcrR family transcriptional regulator
VQDATTRMIDAAERLVAERGLAALTVHAVQEAAGQRNKSAVQYHFGDRQGLVKALLATRMAPANERRTAMMLGLDTDPSTRDLTEVIVVPLVESVLARRPSYWARFLLQALNDPATGLAALDVVSDQALLVAQARLENRLSHLPDAARTLRVRSMVGYACVVLAAYEVGVLPPDLTGSALVAEVVDACCGLADGPSTAAALTHPTAGPDRGTS